MEKRRWYPSPRRVTGSLSVRNQLVTKKRLQSRAQMANSHFGAGKIEARRGLQSVRVEIQNSRGTRVFTPTLFPLRAAHLDGVNIKGSLERRLCFFT